MIPKGKLIRYIDDQNEEHAAILQVNADPPDNVRLSTWTVTALGVVLLTEHLNVEHSSTAGGAPYWATGVPEGAIS